ncbi:MAG: hypothetical protein IPJ31_00690 [Bacteroidetes bacterium]|nr:hypothetical protein [Bacteroidota bacterium]
MKNSIVACSILGLFLAFQSCKTNLKERDINAGSADFSRYVAVGNSLTSGFADGALSRSGQENSYPNMLATQFKLVGGGTFSIPYLDEGGGNDGSNNPGRILGFVLPCNSSTPALSPVLDPKGSTPLNNVSAFGPYNLVGVPGARAIDANLGLYSLLNPFLSRFCLTPAVSTILSEAMRVNATFFTLWLGNNDVLSYSLGGAVPPVNVLSPALSDTTQVRASIQTMLDSLTKNGAKGAIANVPDVTSVPFFTTIPWNGVVLTQGKADTLNALYTANGLCSITWKAGANGFLMVDSAAPPFMRHATASDLILLSTPGDSLKCGQWGVSPAKPLKDAYVLDQAEIATIQLYTARYNQSIAALATAYNVALVDMNSYLKTVKSGLIFNGINLNAVFVSGGAFSLDGVHPNARGYALVANEFLRSINLKYGAIIPLVDVTKYNGVLFP